MSKIPITLISLRNQIIKKQFDASIELLPDRFIYKVEFSADEPIDSEDRSLGMEKVMSYFETTVKKSNICVVDLEYIQATKSNENKESRWCVMVSLWGATHDVKVWFLEQEKARELHKQIIDWIFSE